MKLKSLLMASAAALIAVSGARAADAVIAEPETVDYVRVCDMYGAGFFYIPGTETCLKLGGFVRSTYTHTSVDADDVEDITEWSYRTRLNLTTKNETDLGVLTSVMRLQADGTAEGDGNIGVDRALISLNGFRLGYTDQYWATNHGYGTPGPIDDAPSGFDQAVILDYAYSANGLEVAAGIQDEVGGSDSDSVDLYGGVNYSGGWGSAAATLGYDAIDESSAARLSLSLKPTESLEIKALYGISLVEGKDDAHGNAFIEPEWEYGVGINYQMTDTFNAYMAYRDTADTVNDDNIVIDENAAFVVGGNWDFANNIRFQAETTFEESDTQDYRIRVVRSF